ncbi:MULTISPECIES: hypothetical protein [unclassified Geodermatophilus]|uniref:hypothetical protein n=1 Tax=unclassified Geodermatophilus TaxID=2637632 RepID=UPI003EE98C2F
MTPRRTAAAMLAAAVLLNVAFTGLGSVFDYPDVLKQPADDVLASFRASQAAITGWFLALAVGAAMMVPIAVGVGRLSRSAAMRWAVPVGIAAALVQVAGLLRWPLLVPGWAATAAGNDPAAADAARQSFGTANRVLGNLIGETGGYLLTAAWTGLVLAALGTAFAGRLFVALGAGSAVLVLAGVLSPLDLPLIDTANFVGYILWSLWLLAFAAVLVTRHRTTRAAGPVTGRTARATRSPFLRSWAIWTAGFLAFPVAGLAGTAVAGRVDSPLAALTGGAVAGLVIGAAQTLVSRRRLDPRRWIPATAIGMGLGLLLGAAAVGYGTSLADLAAMGALTGLVLGLAQAPALPPATRRRWVWALALPALWALGWTATTLGGISVEDQFVVFGAYGAVTFSALSGLLLHALLPVGATPGTESAAAPVGAAA